jgi:hypothetical protein
VSNARGWASWARGLLTKDAAAAIAELRAVINAKGEREERQTLYAWYGLLAELQSAAGAVDDALASIKQGLELAERTGGHRMDARLHRLRGDILAKRDPAAAETAYSLRIAREQGARTFELQAPLSLAKLYQSMPAVEFRRPMLTLQRAWRGFRWQEDREGGGQFQVRETDRQFRRRSGDPRSPTQGTNIRRNEYNESRATRSYMGRSQSAHMSAPGMGR